MKTLATVALALLPSSAFGGDFENWFFEFLAGRCEMSGKIFSPDDKQTGTFKGTSNGKVSPSGTKFTESFEYLYQPQNHKAKHSWVWTKGNDGVFRTSGQDPAGNKFSCELTVKSDKSYRLKSTTSDGRTVETKARLKKDGIIHAIDTVRTKKGNVVLVIKYTRSKTRRKSDNPTGEQGGDDQSPTRSDVDK